MLEVGEHHLNLQVDVGGNWGLAEWLKTATHITVHSRGETRAWAVWAILGPFAAILVVDGGDGVIGILPQKRRHAERKRLANKEQAQGLESRADCGGGLHE